MDALGPTEQWLDGIPPGKIAHFAGEARVTDAADMRKVLNDDKRLTLLISLVHECRTSARDEVVTMFCKRMAALHKKGRERLEEIQTANRAETERLIGVLGEVLAAAREATTPTDPVTGTPADAEDQAGPGTEGVAERAGRLVLKALADAGGIDDLATAAEAVSAYQGNNYLPLLERFYRSHRPVLFTLVDAIGLEATSADASVLDAVEFIRANQDRRSDWIPESTPIEVDGQQRTVSVNGDSFASDAWRKVLRDKQRPGMLARRHLEVCVFSYLAAELRSGDIAVAGSDSYANLHAQLMTWDECRPLAADFCAQAGIPTDAAELVAHYRHELTRTAAQVDAGYPANTDLVLDGDRPVLKRRKGADRQPSAIALEAAIHQRLPERSLLDILTRTAYLTGWHRHFGPASGSDPKIRDTLGRYVTTTYAYGTNLGPAEVARHMRGNVSAHEIYTAGNKHSDPSKVYCGSTDVINEFAKLDVAGIWGDGQVVAVDGSQVDTWENNLLAETHIRYGGYGGIAMRHVADSYIALFSHFIPCGVWEAVYIIEGLLRNESDVQPDTIHADTQGQSLPVFGVATLLGFELLPRIRNWHDLIFYRPDARTRYQHIDALFGDNAIDWDLIGKHWTDLLRTAISIREGRVSSVTLLRRLGNHSRKNRLYRAFRELGRVIRTITLLRHLSEPELREQITAITNKAEAFHGYSEWLMVGGKLISHNDPEHQELVVKFNELMANCAIYSTALDITDAANAMAAEGHPVDHDDLATITPYITHTIRRLGDLVLDLDPPAAVPTTRLDLEPPRPVPRRTRSLTSRPRAEHRAAQGSRRSSSHDHSVACPDLADKIRFSAHLARYHLPVADAPSMRFASEHVFIYGRPARPVDRDRQRLRARPHPPAVLTDDHDIGDVMPQRLGGVIPASAHQILHGLQSMQRAVPVVRHVENDIVGEHLTEPIPIAIVRHMPVQGDHFMNHGPVFGGDVQHLATSALQLASSASRSTVRFCSPAVP